MIHYDLQCDKGHAFDGWFSGSDAFDEQQKRGLRQQVSQILPLRPPLLGRPERLLRIRDTGVGQRTAFLPYLSGTEATSSQIGRAHV